jgi:hypothetical protein
VVGYGRAASYRLGPRLALGGGAALLDFQLASRADRYVPPLFARPAFAEEERRNVQTQRGDDTAWSWSAGFLVKSEGGALSLGGVYRRGADFSFRAESRAVEGGGECPEGEVCFAPSDRRARFHVPDAYGLGVAWRPSDALRVSLDLNRIEYSDLTGGVVDIFGLETLFPGRDPELSAFRVDDALEAHLGAEVFFYRRGVPWALRLGSWYEPDHGLRFTGRDPANAAFGAVFRRRGDAFHYSAGVGLSRGRFRLDAAFDFSERTRTVSVSAARRF